MTALDVFISYSSKDKSTADAACATLEGTGIRCWIAPRDILPGEEYGDALATALDGCKVMVLIFSASANISPQVRREVERFVSRGMPVVPLRIENVLPTKALSYFVGSVHWLDALTPPLERHLHELARAVQALLKLSSDTPRKIDAGHAAAQPVPAHPAPVERSAQEEVRASLASAPYSGAPTPKGPAISLDGVHAGYGAIRVLEDVSLKVQSGETVVLLGTNGNGKSTLMKCIMGIVPPTAGSIMVEIDGVHHDLIGQSTEQIVDLGIALVPEGRRLFPRLTVEENLLLGAFRPTARAAIKHNLEFCLEAFPRLRERHRQLAGSLSGGEQQMLALARALMLSPRILLIDEPSVGLAPILVNRTIDKIKELKDQYQLTVLMAEQNFTQAIRIADRGYVIVHGKIAFEGRSAEELNNNDLIRKFYLGL